MRSPTRSRASRLRTWTCRRRPRRCGRPASRPDRSACNPSGTRARRARAIVAPIRAPAIVVGARILRQYRGRSNEDRDADRGCKYPSGGKRSCGGASGHTDSRPGQDLRRADRHRPRVGRHRARRVLHDRRPVRVRQDDAAAHPRRTRYHDFRHHRDRRSGRFRPARQLDGVPGRLDLSLDDGVAERRLRPAHAQGGGGHHQGRGRPLSRPHRAHPLRPLLSAPAFGRHAPARRHRARVRQRSAHPADGRAVQRARRAKQAAAAGRASPHLGRGQEDGGVHHPQRRRGGAARRPGHGDDGAARAGEAVRADRVGAAAQHHGAAGRARIRRAGAPHLVGSARRGAPRPRARGQQGSQGMSVQTTVATPRRERRALSLRDRDRILSIVSPIGLLLVWELAARAGFIDTRFFPAPSAVLALLIEMLKSGELLTHTGKSLQRLAWGTVIGGVPALVLGIVMGLNRTIRALVDPIIAATYPIPKSSILPLALLIFGLGESSKIFMVAIGVFFPVAINATTGVLEINKIYLDVGRNYKADRWNMFWTIALPGALPVIMTGFKLGIGIGLILIAIAEMIGAKSGLGFLIWSAWETFAVEQMYVGLFMIALIGFTLTVALNELERVIIPWKTN